MILKQLILQRIIISQLQNAVPLPWIPQNYNFTLFESIPLIFSKINSCTVHYFPLTMWLKSSVFSFLQAQKVVYLIQTITSTLSLLTLLIFEILNRFLNVRNFNFSERFTNLLMHDHYYIIIIIKSKSIVIMLPITKYAINHYSLHLQRNNPFEHRWYRSPVLFPSHIWYLSKKNSLFPISGISSKHVLKMRFSIRTLSLINSCAVPNIFSIPFQNHISKASMFLV